TIVSCINEETGLIWPATYPNVFGVRAGEVPRGEWRMNRPFVFSACGFPRELPEDTQLYNLHGHSFAAAHFTAWLARFYEKQNNGSLHEAISYFSEVDHFEYQK